MTFTFLCGAVVASAFPRADSFHIFSVFPLVWLLLFTLASTGRSGIATARPGRWQIAVVIGLLCVTGTLAHVRHSHLTHRVSLERAEVWVEPADGKIGR